MKFNPLLLYAALLTFLLFTGGCEHFATDCTFNFSNNWTVEHLDNSGAKPVPASGSISKTAYGLRISNLNPEVIGTNCDYFFASKYVNPAKIVTLRPFDGNPAGTDVSDKFVLRTQTQPAGYVRASQAIEEFYTPQKIDPNISIDLILLYGPDAPDSCQFGVQLLFSDSSTVNLKTNTVYLK